MKRSSIQEKSLKLLKEFLAETPKEEVRRLIDSYIQSNIGGPTYNEYLKGLNSQLDPKKWGRLDTSEEYFAPNLQTIGCLFVNDEEWSGYYVPPPEIIVDENKKDPTMNVGSFFI